MQAKTTDGRNFLLDNAFEEHFKALTLDDRVLEARMASMNDVAEIPEGEKLVHGKASNFIHLLKHSPGEVIESGGRKYMVMENGEWRRIDK